MLSKTQGEASPDAGKVGMSQQDEHREANRAINDELTPGSAISGPRSGRDDVGSDPVFVSDMPVNASLSRDAGGDVAESTALAADEREQGDLDQVNATDWVISERPQPRGARSRHNAMKHGAYANNIPYIAYGPLREDPEEVISFYRGVEADLQPGDSVILRAQVREIASLQWRLFRLQKWEADGYSAPESQTEEYEPDRIAYFASEREFASEVLQRLGDRELDRDEIRRALIALAQVTKKADLAYITTAERMVGRQQLLSGLIAFIDEFYDGDIDRAQSRLAAQARLLRQTEWERRHWDSLVGARLETSSDFTRSLLDAISRTSRELDRAMTRYRLTKQTLMNMQ